VLLHDALSAGTRNGPSSAVPSSLPGTAPA
jgi:hypothetical protein